MSRNPYTPPSSAFERQGETVVSAIYGVLCASCVLDAIGVAIFVQQAFASSAWALLPGSICAFGTWCSVKLAWGVHKKLAAPREYA